MASPSQEALDIDKEFAAMVSDPNSLGGVSLNGAGLEEPFGYAFMEAAAATEMPDASCITLLTIGERNED